MGRTRFLPTESLRVTLIVIIAFFRFNPDTFRRPHTGHAETAFKTVRAQPEVRATESPAPPTHIDHVHDINVSTRLDFDECKRFAPSLGVLFPLPRR